MWDFISSWQTLTYSKGYFKLKRLGITWLFQVLVQSKIMDAIWYNMMHYDVLNMTFLKYNLHIDLMKMRSWFLYFNHKVEGNFSTVSSLWILKYWTWSCKSRFNFVFINKKCKKYIETSFLRATLCPKNLLYLSSTHVMDLLLMSDQSKWNHVAVKKNIHPFPAIKFVWGICHTLLVGESKVCKFASSRFFWGE